MRFPKTFLLIIFAALLCRNAAAAKTSKPNIVYIYADDLGYGDVSCYGATRIKTPNIDQLAKEGIRFTDAHSASSTCTPSRYAFMTGEYPWRKKGNSILPGDAKLIIDYKRGTLPLMLQKAGYKTAAVGKWHMGLGAGNGPIDWNKKIAPGPREVGFDYSFIIPATVDRVPCVFIENQLVVGLDPNDPIKVDYKKKIGNEPTGKEHPELLKMKSSHGHDNTIVNGIGRIGFMSGGKAARWVDEDIADVFTSHAVKFIEENKSHPFFLYLATHDVHVPRTPNKRFQGTSGCGLRGDQAQEFDWTVGEIVKTLKRLNLEENTLVIVSSDNGPVVDDGYRDGSVKNLNGHKPSGPFRGGKYSLFEGGTRIPFIARWPGVIQPGECDALISQVDCFATFAAIAHGNISRDAAPDSFDVSGAILGKSKTGRKTFVEDARANSEIIALRDGAWKFIAPNPNSKEAATPENKHGISFQPQLYNLADDIGETKNLAAQNPELVKKFLSELEAMRSEKITRKELSRR
jgi:arylsulfatase A-like enzyme